MTTTTKTPKPNKKNALGPRKPRAKKTAGQNGNGAIPPTAPSLTSPYLSQLHTNSRVLTAASLSRDRAPLRSVEVPGLGPNSTAGVVFYRPHSTADFLRLVESAEHAKDAAPIEQIKFLVDHLDGRWCAPDGRAYTRDEILALEPSNLALISNAILYAREITVEDHESLLRELGVPLDPAAESTKPGGGDNHYVMSFNNTPVLSPNASGGAPSSAASTD